VAIPTAGATPTPIRARGNSSSPVIPITPFIGVRISWLIIARNSDFAWADASASRASSIARAVVA